MRIKTLFVVVDNRKPIEILGDIGF